jgi:ABC-type sugar transport system ATPase subunit
MPTNTCSMNDDVDGRQNVQAPLLELRGVTKRFGGVAALDGVGFELREGEIHALLGENGAGKSTLIKVLGGIYAPETGEVLIDGLPAGIHSVADAQRHGIRIIHQEMSLVPNMSVAENIFLGREPTQCGWVRRRAMFQQAEQLIETLGLDEIRDVRAIVGQLRVAHQQLVEVARALSCQARILVLDEPTSSLSEAETESLFVTLHRLRTQGVGMIYISHRLEEITRLADRITVLRDGRSIGTQAASQVSHRQLVAWMVGRELAEPFRRPQSGAGAPALEVCHLSTDRVHDVSLTVHFGEIMGLAGLVGAGRSELARAIFGIDRPRQGQVRVAGKLVPITGPRAALRAGIVLVPEDRRREGLVMSHSMAFNTTLPWVADWIRYFMPDRRRRTEIVRRVIDHFAIKVSDAEQPMDSLSGGNQQKVLVGRWMEHRPHVLIVDEPTRGVDVGAREEMFAIISALVEEGMAVLLISSDLNEVVGMSHRIAVYRDGRVLSVMPREACSLVDIMGQLTGAETA